MQKENVNISQRKKEILPDAPKGEDESLKSAKILGKYRIDEELGRGGMGIVYKAFDTTANRTVAIKVLGSQTKITEKISKRFIQEARQMAQLNHPNIVKIFEVLVGNNQQAIVMEYIEGQDIISFFEKEKRKQSKKAIVGVVSKVGEALIYMHKQDIIHRDIKPSNIMVTKKTEVKVMDFGLAKEMKKKHKSIQADTLTNTGDFLGTPEYMSPEQAEGKKDIDGRADQFSLGATLYRMLIGKSPFAGTSTYDTLYNMANKEIVSPMSVDKSIPSDLNAICLKSLEKNRNRRYQSMEEFVQDLKNYLEGESTIAQPPLGLEKIWKWVRKNAKIVIPSMIFSLTAFVAFLYNYYSIGIERDKAIQAKNEANELRLVSEKLNDLERMERDGNSLGTIMERVKIMLKDFPDNVSVYIFWVDYMLRKENNDHIKKCIDGLLQFEKKNGKKREIVYSKALAYKALNEIEKYKACLNELAALDSGKPEHYFSKCSLLEIELEKEKKEKNNNAILSSFSEIIKTLEEGILQHKDFYFLQGKLENIYSELGDFYNQKNEKKLAENYYKKALEKCKEVQKLNPYEPKGFMLAGRECKTLSELEEKKKSYLDNSDKDYDVKLKQLEEKKKNYLEQAIEYFTESVKLKYDYYQARVNRADSYWLLSEIYRKNKNSEQHEKLFEKSWEDANRAVLIVKEREETGQTKGEKIHQPYAFRGILLFNRGKNKYSENDISEAWRCFMLSEKDFMDALARNYPDKNILSQCQEEKRKCEARLKQEKK